MNHDSPIRWEPQHSRIASIGAFAALLAIRVVVETEFRPPDVVVLLTYLVAAAGFAGLPISFLELSRWNGRKLLRIGALLSAVAYPIYWLGGGISQVFGVTLALQIVAVLTTVTAGAGYIIIGTEIRQMDEVFGHKPRGFGFVYLFFGVVLVAGRVLGSTIGAAFVGLIFLSDYIVIWATVLASVRLFRPKDPPGIQPMRPLG